ncbi:MAG: cytochrome c biogenesis protein CcdA [Pyramidobacter sp.]|nr:cytochrome c biogenesis protein CcdA [Pyramidobacter sp.]
MNGLISALDSMFSAQGLGACVISALWGSFSMILSPCGFVLVPMVIGYIRRSGRQNQRSALAISLCFAAGVFINLVFTGGAICFAGKLLSHASFFVPLVNYTAAVLLFLFGLHLLDVFELPHHHARVEARGAGLKGALTLGVISGLAAGPCALTHFMPVLLAAFKAAGDNALFSVAAVLSYAVGYCAVIIVAGVSSERLAQKLNLGENSRAGFIFNQICGWLIILAGAHFLYEA